MIEEHRDVMMENYQEKYKKRITPAGDQLKYTHTKRFFLDFCDYSAPLDVDISENLYCGFQNLYHGSRGVGGDGNSCFIHL